MSHGMETPPRILVADEDDGARQSLQDNLRWIGFASDGAKTHGDALVFLEATPYDLVFCDLMLSNQNGFDLLGTIRLQFPTLPVIVLSNNATVRLAQKAIRLGAQDFIAKPINTRELPFIIARNLARMRLLAQIHEKQTEQLLFQTVQALTAAIEAKDPYTAGHSQTVALLANQFVGALQLDDTDSFITRMAGMMHDVGKIGIPERVLLKRGKLDDHEWEIMKQHPIISAEIVSQVSDLNSVAQVVRAHHERWDGSGYPDGLAGDNIPLLSRILYIADAYDALTADRAYRKGMSHLEAMSIIKRQAGASFDAELVLIMEEYVFPSLGPDWRVPSRMTPHLSRTTVEAMNAQMPFQAHRRRVPSSS